MPNNTEAYELSNICRIQYTNSIVVEAQSERSPLIISGQQDNLGATTTAFISSPCEFVTNAIGVRWTKALDGLNETSEFSNNFALGEIAGNAG
jgi:hypothetical protein